MILIMALFSNEDYKIINNLIEKRLPILKENKDFNKKYTNLFDAMEKLEKTLSQEQKEQFDEIVQLFYETEEYYFALSYSLGVKYGEDLKKL